MTQSARFRLLDTRVGLTLKNERITTDLVVSPTSQTQRAFEKLQEMAYFPHINRLLLICHSGWDPAGVYWLKIGERGVDGTNIREMMAPVKGCFDGDDPAVEIRACRMAVNPGGSPADILPARGSGAALCHAMADLLGVSVLASDVMQPGPCTTFWNGGVNEDGQFEDWGDAGTMAKRALPAAECSEGTWKGTVYRFRPGKAGATIEPASKLRASQ